MAKPIVTRDRLRLLPDQATNFAFRDYLTGQVPTIWRGNVIQFEVGLGRGLPLGGIPTSDDQFIDLTGSGLQSLTLLVRDSAAATASTFMSKTVTVFDDTLGFASWIAQTKQHAVFDFSAEEANIAAGNYTLILSGITTTGPLDYGVSQLTVLESGIQGVADPAPNPGAAISLAQADARYATAVADGPAQKRGCTAIANAATSTAIAFATPFGAAPSVVLCTLAVPDASHPLLDAAVDWSSVTAAGFSFLTPAGTPAAGYKANWLALA